MVAEWIGIWSQTGGTAKVRVLLCSTPEPWSSHHHESAWVFELEFNPGTALSSNSFDSVWSECCNRDVVHQSCKLGFSFLESLRVIFLSFDDHDDQDHRQQEDHRVEEHMDDDLVRTALRLQQEEHVQQGEDTH